MAKETLLALRRRLGLDERQTAVKCSCCGKPLVVPNLFGKKVREVLKPFCCATTVLHVQWLIYHGWHVRNLGLHDSHPYFCPDCWKEGTPEYSKSEECEAWCKQAQAWLDNNGRPKNVTKT